MSMAAIERDFRAKVSQQVELYQEGIERYRVFTPFRFDDGDHLVVVFKKDGEGWMLTDEAHTYMRLTYDLDESDPRQDNRQKIIHETLSEFRMEDRDGELIIHVTDDQYGDALLSFIQAILQITNVS